MSVMMFSIIRAVASEHLLALKIWMGWSGQAAKDFSASSKTGSRLEHQDAVLGLRNPRAFAAGRQPSWRQLRGPWKRELVSQSQAQPHCLNTGTSLQ
jgi:hypothetical protein